MSKMAFYLCLDEVISTFAMGSTPDEAFGEFISNGEFYEYCGIHEIEAGIQVEVFISKIIRREEADSEELAMMEHEGWDWVTSHVSETRMATAPEVDHE